VQVPILESSPKVSIQHKALLISAAKAYDDKEFAMENLRKTRNTMQKYGQDYYEIWKRDVPEDDETQMNLQKEYNKWGKIRDEAENLILTCETFNNESLKQDGVTPYADSYVKDQVKGWRYDVWEYSGEIRSDIYSGIKPRNHVSRAANENFAELSMMMTMAKNYGIDAKEQLNKVKKTHKKLFQAFKKLWDIVGNVDAPKVPEGKAV
jgi:hypothetical protein